MVDDIKEIEKQFKNSEASIMDYDTEQANYENILGGRVSVLLRNEKKIIRFMICQDEFKEVEGGYDSFPSPYEYIIIEEDLKGNILKTYKIDSSLLEKKKATPSDNGEFSF